MPTDRTANGAAGRQRDEPPRSPTELDRRIMQRAREKASEYTEYSNIAGLSWPAGSWKTAVGLFSVAVIAVSVTLQVFDNSLERSATSDVSDESIASENQADDTFSQAPFLQEREAPIRLSENAVRSAAPAGVANDVSVVEEPADSQLVPASPATTNTSAREAQQRQRAIPPSTPNAELALSTGLAVDSDAGDIAADTPPGLETLLQQLPESRGNVVGAAAGRSSSAAGQAAPASSENSRAVLADVLALLTRILDPAGVAVVAELANDGPPATDQLGNLTADLVARYNAVESSQQLTQLEERFSQQRDTINDLSLPLTLELMIRVLERWIAEGQTTR